MAQKVQVMLVCDLHDDEQEVEGTQTLTFGLEGSSYEIDVCEEHAAALHDAFAPYVGAARRGGRQGGTSAQRRGGRTASAAAPRPASGSAGRRHVQEVREWARANGHAVSERGRLSGEVLRAYEAAH